MRTEILRSDADVPASVAVPRIVRWWRNGPENFIKLADRGVWAITDDTLVRLGLSGKVDAAECFAEHAAHFRFVKRDL